MWWILWPQPGKRKRVTVTSPAPVWKVKRFSAWSDQCLHKKGWALGKKMLGALPFSGRLPAADSHSSLGTVDKSWQSEKKMFCGHRPLKCRLLKISTVNTQNRNKTKSEHLHSSSLEIGCASYFSRCLTSMWQQLTTTPPWQAKNPSHSRRDSMLRFWTQLIPSNG